MSTPLTEVYASFTSKILSDEWSTWTEQQTEQDYLSILKSAIPYFRFPRVSLEISGSNFISDLNLHEINILGVYMKCEWYNRVILSWDNIRPLYDESDFSPANLLDKFSQRLDSEKKNAKYLEEIYYRSINGVPYNYGQLATHE